MVGGWHPGERGLAGKFGSLLVGVYEGDRLWYAGKVGTGLVAEVAFAEWTSSGTLRHPSYVALRDDKAPREVVRES